MVILGEIEQQLIDTYFWLRKNVRWQGYIDLFEGLDEHPGAVDVFIQLFENEEDPYHKEKLAAIILMGRQYQPAMDFLNEMGWNNDFAGFFGFLE